jgi:hypothetical protein
MPAILAGFVVFVFVGGLVVMWLWNWLLPALFGWPALTVWQAIGLLALTRILFGGFGFHGRGRGRMRRHFTDRMADGFGDRWDRMTAEERARFRERIRQRCGFDPAPTESQI